MSSSLNLRWRLAPGERPAASPGAGCRNLDGQRMPRQNAVTGRMTPARIKPHPAEMSCPGAWKVDPILNIAQTAVAAASALGGAPVPPPAGNERGSQQCQDRPGPGCVRDRLRLRVEPDRTELRLRREHRLHRLLGEELRARDDVDAGRRLHLARSARGGREEREQEAERDCQERAASRRAPPRCC